MKTLNELTLLDKFLFDEVMDIPEAHEAALRIILGDENLRLLTPSQTEKELRTAPWLSSIRLDVYSMDENLRIYNTEAQKTRKPDLPRRSRFYQSVMDSSLLKSGDESFNLLNDTFNIIITPFDLFGEGRYCYTFHARCDENPSLVLEDGATRIFLNTRGTNRNEVSEELIQFLEYMEQSTLNVDIPDTNGNLIKIHNHVRQVKASEEIGVKFMQRWEEEAMWKREGREAGLAAGLAEGLSKGQTINQISIIRFQFLTKRKTPELIADDLGLSLAFVQQICDLLTTHPQEPDEKLADYFLTRQSKILANR
ncbi:Rpn family recombination-promoting nuclease/putative transposase [Clostridiaceae bacterium AF29-16BH]|nr:Rpn family recombination-promoting nuclease/putative transposase [Clostridiaceae bacterium AF29-16BH]